MSKSRIIFCVAAILAAILDFDQAESGWSLVKLFFFTNNYLNVPRNYLK